MNTKSPASMDLEKIFNGPLVCNGVILNRKGMVTRRFRADMFGTWQQNASPVTGTLTESFYFDDGEKLERRWRFTRTGNNIYRGTAADIEGTANLMTRGADLFMRYRLRVPVKGREIVLTADDRLWLTPEGVIMNRSILKKFGIRVGEIVGVIMRGRAAGEER